MDELILTFDVDWAPDFVIDEIASLLYDKRVSATWFVTHDSPAIRRLREEPALFELGMHPNFLPGSTHGATPAQVLRHVRCIVPEAVSIRSHAVVHSGPLLHAISTDTQIQIESTQFLPGMRGIQPIEYWCHKRSILRLPFFWADDYVLTLPKTSWVLAPLLAIRGCKVMNFHPIHVYLNSATAENYQQLKQAVMSLEKSTEEAVAPFIHPGRGTRNLFMDVVDHLSARCESQNLQTYCQRWRRAA